MGARRKRRKPPGFEAWLAPLTSVSKLDFRVEVTEAGLLLVEAWSDGRRVLPEALFERQWARPDGDFSLAMDMVGSGWQGGPRSKRALLPRWRSAETLALLARRRAEVVGGGRRPRPLVMAPGELHPVLSLSRLPSGDLSASVEFERDWDQGRVCLEEGVWVVGAPTVHYEPDTGLVTRVCEGVPPLLFERLLEAPATACPASEAVDFFTTSLPALAGALGVELPELDHVADVMRFDPVFRLEAHGAVRGASGEETIDEVWGRVTVRYGDLEKPLSTSEQVTPLLARWSEPRVRATVARCDEMAERDATDYLLGTGLVPGDEPGVFVATGARAARFWAQTLGELPERWELLVPEGLTKVVLRQEPVQYEVRVHRLERAGGDRLEVTAGWQSEGIAAALPLPLPMVASARSLFSSEGSPWSSDSGEGASRPVPSSAAVTHVRLVDGSWAPLPERALLSPMVEVAAAIDRIAGRPTGGRVALGFLGELTELSERLPRVTLSGGVRGLYERLTAIDRLAQAPSPRALKVELRPYQRQGLEWLSLVGRLGTGAILADDMGLGKTVQTLALLLSFKAKKRSLRALVVAPTSVAPNWAREIERLSVGLSVVVWHGGDRRQLEREMRVANVIVTSYSLLRLDEELWGGRTGLDFDYVILDEAQTIKNPDSATARAAKRVTGSRRLALTGTPIENRLTEIWSIFDFVAPGVLSSLSDFEEEYARPIEQGGKEGEEAARRLRAAIHPFVLRRTKAEVLDDLPEKIESDDFIELGPRQRAAYAATLADVRETVMGEVDRVGVSASRIHVLAGLTRLRQAACDARLCLDDETAVEDWSDSDSAKVMAFVERIRLSLDGGHRALVFSQFVSMLTILCVVLDRQGIRYEYLDGSTVNRQARVDRFQSDASIPVFLISLKAGGSGLNLTGADTVIHFDPWWNPAVEDQASDRAHRFGQKNVVRVHRFIAAGTIEEKILALKEKKRELAQAVLGDDETRAAALSRQDLELLFS